MYETEFKRILEASRNNTLTFFVGAGVSTLSGAPSWKCLIDEICDQIGLNKKDSYDSDEYLKIPQIYYYSLETKNRKRKFQKFVENKINVSGLSPNKIHEEMLKLNPASYITTNYDCLLEEAAMQRCQSYKVISCDNDVSRINGDKFILKIHGDFEQGNFVLKEEDYLNYDKNFALMETLTKSIFSTNTVVFIGYRLGDYDINLILNWVKTLLGNSFRKPIFVYAGKNAVTESERRYYESKGLVVVDSHMLLQKTTDYPERYQIVFDELRKLSEFSMDGKNIDSAFDLLYNRLQPLDSLEALRLEDIKLRLNHNVYIRDDGVICPTQGNSLLFKKFMDLNRLHEKNALAISDDEMEKYHSILSVLKRALIRGINEGAETARIFYDMEVTFSDNNVLLFDYKTMQAYTNQKYCSAKENYRKAYYLYRTCKYEDAFYLFYDIAKECFIMQDYLMYYFSEMNCINLGRMLCNGHMRFKCKNVTAIEELLPYLSSEDTLFRRLPTEFQNTYKSLEDICGGIMLYKYSYGAFVDGIKVQHAVEVESLEFGLTSTDKVTCRINEYLHFILRNSLIVDIFSEYRIAVKNLMSSLVYKYSIQDKRVLHEMPFPEFENDKVCFDEVDFYCFIEFFSSKDIIELFGKNNIESIEFNNIKQIEQATNNILDFYEIVEKEHDNTSILNLGIKIKNILALFRYTSLSLNMIERICFFILSREFLDIHIDDKVLFLDRQIYRRSMYSEKTAKVIENVLITYIDKEIKNHGKFRLPTTTSGINYCNLVRYIYPHDQYSFRRLSLRVTEIIDNQLEMMYNHIIEFYYDYVSKYQKKNIIAWAKSKLEESFDFKMLRFLIKENVKISKDINNQLLHYLRETISESEKMKLSKGITKYPRINSYDELEVVGYWCFQKVIKFEDYAEFLGKSAKFDFFYQYNKFDFTRFKTEWLFPLSRYALHQLSQSKNVKEKIRHIIAAEICSKSITTSDVKRLQDILVQYFC